MRLFKWFLELANVKAGETAVNHNRCLHMTAEEFYGRLRASRAATDDFDEVLLEFGRGCPCKNPPLKSSGKTHLKSQTHQNAFTKVGGPFYGLSVRAVLERGVPVQIVEGAANIANANADQSMGESGRANEVDDYDMMIEAHGQQQDEVAAQDEFAADEDLSYINLEEADA